ncbi:MAG: hypothetical protein WCE75_10825 [Terracidiphilus sp.]
MKSVQIPDDLYQQAAALAARDHVSVDRFVAALVQSHAAEWERLRTRAARGSLSGLHAALAKVADDQPGTFDRIS